MTDQDIIQAMQIGLDDAVNLIEFLVATNEDAAEDPQVKAQVEQLKQLLVYSTYSTNKHHPLYEV